MSNPGARLAFQAEPGDAGARLDIVLARRLSVLLGQRVSKGEARKLIVVGAVRVAGRAVRQPGRPLTTGVSVDLVLRRGTLKERPRDDAFELTPPRVLFEDAFLIAVDKPPGLPTHPTLDAGRPSLVGAVKRYLASGRGRNDAAEEPYLGVHQRLDRDTTGVVLFVKHESANAGLAAQFEGRRVGKVYLAWTSRPAGAHPVRWRADDRLAAAPGRPPRMRVVREGGQTAVTDFERRLERGRAWLLEARPRTGRKHQIRVQLAAAGLPVLGDVLYGGKARIGGRPVPRPLLHALRLELLHPITGEPLAIECAPPDDFSAAALGPGAARARRRPR